ncbi:MAG TPA: hypothetical protein VE978_24800 [Chitinophagales bacterium]|nr:hypothetical protein [Chitinophagales bacterium]
MTNYSHARCYANIFNDCSKKISREHYFSQSILKEIANVFILEGVLDEPKSVPISGLVVKCLCERHNNMLSDFDSEALLLFRTIKRYDFETHPRNVSTSKSETVEIDGRKFENWILKTTYNFNEGNLFTKNKSKTKYLINPYYLDVLFKDKPFNAGCGMSIVMGEFLNVGDKIHLDQNKLILTTRFESKGELCGIGVLFHGILFTLTLNPSVEYEVSLWNKMRGTFHCPGFILRDENGVINKEVKFIY